MLRPVCLRLAFICAAITAGFLPCVAEDDDPQFETYITADYAQQSAALASSTVWSFLGPVNQPGLRLKLDSFLSINGATDSSLFSSAFMAADLKTLGDIMLGYQFKRGSFWVKLYAGAATQSQAMVFWQIGQAVQQQGYGATAAVEGFWRGTGRYWASGDVSWLQFDNTVSVYERTAYEFFRESETFKISAGMESAAMISDADMFKAGKHLDLYNQYVREGVLLNLKYWSHDLTLSGGMAKASNEGSWYPYATLSYGKKF